MADPLVDPEAPASFRDFVNKQRGLKAETSVLHAQDDDPAKAAGAVKLEQTTGQDASYIYGNYDDFVKNQKADLVGGLVGNDDLLRDYVLSHPLAASVSKDDWGPMSDYSQALREAQSMGPYEVPEGLKPAIGHIFEGAKRGFETGWESTPGPTSEEEMERLGLPENFKKFVRAAKGVPGTPFWGADILTKGLSGVVTAIAEAGAEFSRQTGGDEASAARTARNLYELATVLPMIVAPEMVTEAGAAARTAKRAKEWEVHARREITKGVFGPSTYKGEPRVLEPKEISEAKDSLANMLQRTGTFIKAGELPPLGADRIMDLILGADAHMNFKIVDNLIKVGGKTGTKQLSPEMFQKMTELAVKGHTGLNYDEVRALYGDKTPEPGDGLLGDIAGVAEQFTKNDRTGKEIEVPTAEFVTKVSKDVWTALQKSARLRLDGATLNEFEQFQTPEYQASRPSVLRPEIEGYDPKAVVEETMRRIDDVRTAAGMEPYFAREAGIPPKRLQLAPSRGVPFPALRGEHSFVITDEIGRHMADLELTPSPDGRDLEINWIGGHVPMHQTPEMLRNMFSPGLLKDLLRQVQDQFPEAKTISGTRLGPKEGGRVSVEIARAMSDPGYREMFQDLFGSGDWIPFGRTTEALIKPTAAWTAKESRIFTEVQTLLNRILPSWARTVMAHELRDPTTGAMDFTGTYLSREGMVPTILWSLTSGDPIGTARHEAIHFLRRQGIITRDEWNTLVWAAIKGNWIAKHKISERYGWDAPIALRLEEAIAEEYKSWANSKNKNEHSGNFVYQKLQRLLQAIEEIVRKHFGEQITADDLFENIEAGTVGRREHREALKEFQQHWPDETTMRQLRPEEQSLALESAKSQAAATPKEEQPLQFARGTLHPGRTHDQYTRTIKKWMQKNLDREQKELVKEEMKRLAPKWKEDQITMEQEVTNDLRNRPDFKVQRFFQHGEYKNVKTGFLPKLDPKYIWPDQLKSIPKQFLADGGLDPAKIAPEFGYPDGYSLVADMAELAKSRGPEGPKAYFTKLVKDEVDRRMKAKYGTPEEQALKNAREHATDPDLFNIMWEDGFKFFTMAQEAGHKVDTPISKDNMKAAAWQDVLSSPIRTATLRESHAELGRLFRELEGAYLGGRGDPVRAYKLSQRRANEMAKALVLRTIEKQKAAFERAMKAGYKRDPTGLPFSYAAWLHHVMSRIGREIQRDPEDLAKALEKGPHQPYNNLQEFANDHNFEPVGASEDELQRNAKLPVYEKFNDPNWTVDIDKTNVDEFLQINNTVQALIKFGRDSERVTIGADRLLKYDVVQQLVKQMQKFTPYGTYTPKRLEEVFKNIRTMGGGLIKWTVKAERMDLFDPNGPWTKYIAGPIDKTAVARRVLERDHSRMFRNEMAKVKDKETFEPTREVPNASIYDPNGWSWTDPEAGRKPYVPEGSEKFKQMTEENLVMAIVYWLEPTARDKLVKGYLTSEAEMGSWIWKNSKKVHWDLADKIGEVFERFAKEEDDVTRRQSGGFIKRLPTPPVEGPPEVGTVKGRYYPVVHDTSVAVPKGLEIHPTHGMLLDKGFTKERTGIAAPLDLTFTTINHQMKRRTDFIAWEETLESVRKIIKDPEFAQNLRVQHGPHALESLTDWVKDIAGRPGDMPAAARVFRNFVSFMVSRSVGDLVGFRTATIGKHVPGAAVMGAWEAPKGYPKAVKDLTYLKSVDDLFRTDSKTRGDNHDLIDNGDPSIGYKGSAELKSRGMTLKDTFGEAVDYSLGKIGPAGKFRDAWNQVSSSIFRVADNFFSRLTFWSGFTTIRDDLMRKGYSYEDATHIASERADVGVRKSHGSLATVTLPEYLRQQDPMMRNSTAIFAFWSNRSNRLFLTGAKMKDMAMLRRNKTFFKDFGDVTANMLVYGLAPMIIEDLVEPICHRDESDLACFAKWGTFATASFFPGGREIAWAALSGMNPGGGVIGSSWRSGTQVAKAAKQAVTGDIDEIDWGRTIKSSLFLGSLATGLVGGLQAGLVADYIWKLNHEDERLPETPEEYARLLFAGKVEEKKHEKQNIWGRMFGEGPNR